jgi:hypothetical protein
MGSISLLQTPLTLCKKYSGAGASIKSLKPAMAKHFSYEQRAVTDIQGLSALLTSLEQDPHKAIIRGVPADDVDTEKQVRRKLRRSTTSEPNEEPFLDQAASWIMIDVDKLLLPSGMDVVKEPLSAIQYAIEQLPSEFHDASYHWQLSASAGVKDTNTLSVHLYFWLDRSLSNELLRGWANSLNNKRLVDHSVYNPVQLHYTAAPLFADDTANPFRDNRSGFTTKAKNSVCLKLPSAEERNKANSSSASSMELDENRVRGFNNILATLGDHEGGDGFNRPLLRSTASYVSKAGRDIAEKSMDSLIDTLRIAIDNADQSSHCLEEIERYKSDRYLTDLIVRAIDKFGDSPDLAFNTTELSLAEGEDALEKAITEFAEEVKSFNTTLDNLVTPTLAIKATAGLGKTSKIITKLISESALKNGDVHYFVPNHRLSKELVHDLEAELNLSLSNEGSQEVEYSRVRLISGRSQLDSTGRTMCWKNEIASKVAASGQAVSSTLCKSGSQQCEYYEQCGYQDQFEESGIEIPKDDPLTEIFWEVSVMTHSHMFLNTKDRLHEPGLIIVDESFYQSGISTEEITPTEVYQTNQPIARHLHHAILSGEKHLLGYLRNLDYSSSDLDAEAEGIEASYTEEARITPSMTEAQQSKSLRSSETRKKAALLLRQLADEMRITDRTISHSVFFDAGKDKIILKRRKQLTIPSYIPTIFIDADVQPEILKQFRDGAELVEIPVERKATVHQFTDLTFSKTALEGSDSGDSELLSQVKEFAQSVAQHSKTLLVCSKTTRRSITGEPGDKLEQDYDWEGVTVTHFGSIRGVNRYKDYTNVIIVGRNQPPATASEEDARAMWWDDEAPLELLEAKKGNNKPLEEAHRGYRTTSGNSASVTVRVHPDERVQLMLEQIREAESVQAIDRLRLLRDNPVAGDRQVFILSSVPLDITVTNLWSWKRLQLVLELWREADGVLPLDANQLVKRCPNVGSVKTAGRRIKEIVLDKSLIVYLIRSVSISSVSYRKVGQKKQFTALIDTSLDDQRLISTLSDLAGQAVEII